MNNCPLCNHTANSPRFKDGGKTIVSCEQCELLFITPYPAVSEEVYETVSEYDYEDLTILSPERHYDASRRLYNDSFGRFAPHFDSATTVLDVGCGTGHLLELLGKFDGLRRTGLELNRPRAEFARKVAGCEILEEPLEAHAPDKKYDVILMMDLIAHVPNLHGFFEATVERMSEKGKLVLRVGEYSKHVRKSTHFDWQIPDHLQFLGLNTAEYLAKTFDLEIADKLRTPLAEEMFSRRAWQASGRSNLRNSIKASVVKIPFLLSTIRTAYSMTSGKGHFASTIVFAKA